MDSDGCVDHRGQAEFTSISEVLSRGVLELALTLAQKATRRKGDAKLYGIRISDKWRVTFAPTIHVFSLPRKAEILKGPMERRGRVTLPKGGTAVHSLRRAGIHGRNYHALLWIPPPGCS